MTKSGVSFIASGVFVYFLASQSQIGWLYLFDTVIWSLLLLSVILPWYNLRSLRVERQVLLSPSSARHWQLGGSLEDEEVEVRLKVTNLGRLARYFIRVVEECPFDQPGRGKRVFFITRLKPKSTVALSYTATCYRRGHYPSASTAIESSGPLGLMVRRRVLRPTLKLTVYPRYYPMEGLPAAETAWAEWGHGARSSAADEFYGSREYQPGEPLKHIHWRNTARLGYFMLKQFERQSQGGLTVAFEAGRDFGVGRETTLEYSIKVAASLARLAADCGHNIDIITGETPLRNAGWQEAMEYLAHLEAGTKTSLAELEAPGPERTLVVIVPATETHLIPTLAQLARRTRRLVVVLLRGFAPDEMPDVFQSGLKRENLDIVSCVPGGLEEAIEALGALLSADKIAVS
ncbi:MAG TPA: DUF58 domain-containing protein [Dehalococcoidia bacterium]|nr:DUF58 domain-containing protein [Dehalococcoidia bacterium]